MGFTKDGICEYCYYDLTENETELVCSIFLRVIHVWRRNYYICIHADCWHDECRKTRPVINRLEELGYITTADSNDDCIQIRPTGIEIDYDDVTICANRLEHDAMNYAF